MRGELVFVLILMVIVIGIPVISSTILKIVKQNHENENSKSSQLDKEEAEIMHELHKGLEKMEKRIDALETIIMDKKR